MSSGFQRSYGRTVNPFVCPKPNSDSILIGGSGDDGGRWTRVITLRAARLLWYHLGAYLYPAEFANSAPGLNTIPLRAVGLPNITSDLRLDPFEDGGCEIVGRGSGSEWSARLDSEHAPLLWAALDSLLHNKG